MVKLGGWIERGREPTLNIVDYITTILAISWESVEGNPIADYFIYVVVIVGWTAKRDLVDMCRDAWRFEKGCNTL